MVAVRYQVRAIDWGDRRRFEVVDSSTGTTLAILANRVSAEDEVIALNLGRTITDEAPPSGAEEVLGTRQCGRCRGVFPADPAREPVALVDWWVCDACGQKLLGRAPILVTHDG